MREAVAKEAAAREAEAKVAKEREAVAKAAAEAKEAAAREAAEREVARQAARSTGAWADPLLVLLPDVLAATDCFNATRMIGQGGCATVYKAEPLPSLPSMLHGSSIAVKRLNMGGSQGEAELILGDHSHPLRSPRLGWARLPRTASAVEQQRCPWLSQYD